MAGMQKKPIKQIDLYNEQFNYYFTERLNNITPKELALLPKDLAFKIYKGGVEGSAERLSFQEMMWILSVVFTKNITIMVEDRENGVNMVDFGKANRASRGKIVNGELLEDMRIKASFVIADRELMAASLYMNHVSTSNIYSLIKTVIPNVNHSKNQKFVQARRDMNLILTMLTNYEATKRRIAMDYGLTMPMWYALLYFSTGEKLGASFYSNDAFKYAYSSNRLTMHKDMKYMEDHGYLLRRGEKLKYRYTLTSAGLNLLSRIMDNIVLKF